MSNLLIPTVTNESNQEQVTALDGTNYIIRRLWNSRAQRWFMTIKTADNLDIATGRKLCADMPWASRETVEEMPPGQIWVIRGTKTGADPGLRELNREVFLMYVEEDTLG